MMQLTYPLGHTGALGPLENTHTVYIGYVECGQRVCLAHRLQVGRDVIPAWSAVGMVEDGGDRCGPGDHFTSKVGES